MTRLNARISLLFIFVLVLLILGVGCRTASPEIQSNFFQAILDDNFNGADYLLSLGADINAIAVNTYVVKVGRQYASTGLGETALHMTATYGKIDGVKWLLGKGADVNIKATNDGSTPLLRAIFMGTVLYNSLDIANLLINKGADINVQDDNGWTPLHHAANAGNNDFVRMLLEKGANINAKTDKDWTALYLAVRDCPIDTDRHTRKAIDGQPLYLGVRDSQIDTVKLLLEEGAAVNVADNEDHTIMQIAKKNGNTEIIALLQSYGGKE